MNNSIVGLYLCVLLTLAGCVAHESGSSNSQNDSSVDPGGSPPARTAVASDQPSLTPLEADAETLRRLLGYRDVVAYEFRGTWLECWLECEVDGDLAEKTPHVRISPRAFTHDQKVEFADSERVTGWVTVWGVQDEHLNLVMRGQLPQDDATQFPFTIPAKLTIPPGDIDRSQGMYTSLVGLEAGWMRRVELPAELGEPFTIRSYHFEERQKTDDPAVRKVRVSLKAVRPKESVPPAAVENTDKDDG